MISKTHLFEAKISNISVDVSDFIVGYMLNDCKKREYQKWGSNPRGHTSIGT